MLDANYGNSKFAALQTPKSQLSALKRDSTLNYTASTPYRPTWITFDMRAGCIRNYFNYPNEDCVIILQCNNAIALYLHITKPHLIIRQLGTQKFYQTRNYFINSYYMYFLKQIEIFPQVAQRIFDFDDIDNPSVTLEQFNSMRSFTRAL